MNSDNMDNNNLKEINITIKSEAYENGIPTFIKNNPKNYISKLEEIHKILYLTKHKPNFEEIIFEKIDIIYLNNLLLLHKEWFPIDYQKKYFIKFLEKNNVFYSIGAFIIINNKKYLIGSILYEICNESKFRENIPSVLYDQNIIDLCFSNKKCAYINTIGVIDEYRKLKVASKLIEIMIEDLKNKNVIAVYLHVILHNLSAIKFYEKINWNYWGIIKGHYYINRKTYDAKVFYFIINEYYEKKHYLEVLNTNYTSQKNCFEKLYYTIINLFKFNNTKESYILINQLNKKV